MKKLSILLLYTTLLLLSGCQQAKNPAPQTNNKTEEATELAPAANTEEDNASPYATENKEYNLSLPKAEAFGKELKDFIYWEYATEIKKDEQKFSSVLTKLENKDCLNKELKLHLYYQECDGSDFDFSNSNYYDVIVTFPEEKQIEYFTFNYTAKGLSSNYDYGSGWSADDIEDAPSQKSEQEEEFLEQYTFFGETSLTLSKEDAANYEAANHFADGEKEHILQKIEETIKEEYSKCDNAVICVRDFLPGDTEISGEVIYMDIVDEDFIPLYWITSILYYSDKKMEHFDDVYWFTHYSTAFHSAPNSEPITVEQRKEYAEEEKAGINMDKCILAYQIKDGELIDLKKK